MKIFLLVFLFMCTSTLYAKELFTRELLLQYFTQTNPYIYSAIGKEYIDKETYHSKLGDFDTKVVAKYDKKEYPVSKGEFVNLYVEKPIENGMEFSLGYRRAEGVQEYNNIKTSKDGEMLAGIKIPVFSVINDTSTRKLNLDLAYLNSVKSTFSSKENLRKLYFEAFKLYNQLLYQKEIVRIEADLFKKAKKRELIISKRVQVGELAEIALIEAKQQVINRKQRIVTSENKYRTIFEIFLKYMHLSRENFNDLYLLPSMPTIEKKSFFTQKFITQALEKRADLKIYDYNIKKIHVEEQKTNMIKYPKFDISLYGVHDLKYDNGFKVALDMNFPIERRKYEALYIKNQKSISKLQSTKQKKIINIKTNIKNIILTLNSVYENIENSFKEVALVERLEQAEYKKYILGISNLFMLNQREIYTLDTKKKLLRYSLEFLLLEEELKKETATVSHNLEL